MMIVMTLLVRDEEDVIAANLDYHLEQGVDHIIVTDNLSVDSTPKLLKPYARAGKVTILDELQDNYNQHIWVTRMARLAEEIGADWVINSDADEFWWPISGSLRSALETVPESVDLIACKRTNFLPSASSEGSFFGRMVYREPESRNALDDPLPPKVCHRAFPDIYVAQGNHHVWIDGLELTAMSRSQSHNDLSLSHQELFAIREQDCERRKSIHEQSGF